eukprot:CAMPEP_0204258832 /NCGR_PEP_ID=MMETSP0468-20130131/5184_1 /ASSEMBLY_ACC=CAM_ASM_000383 /TAXON_ID=2969 /ORGANISM="Oxyrrhis marina" /LENGTH=406 /DNA_ID=CAMNT_0051233033 /DNA_START=39 /DNA_END=1259 /DNA_ORIENTATION=-
MATKLFLGGLAATTTTTSINQHFSAFGEVAEATVMCKGNKSRGFGFVVFKSVDAAAAACAADRHVLDGRVIDVKFAVPREEVQANKVFVGGLSHMVDVPHLMEYFGQFGVVVDATIQRDRQTNRSRGFAFVRFLRTATVDVVIAQTHHIAGRRAEVKRALPETAMSPAQPVAQRVQDWDVQAMNTAWPSEAEWASVVSAPPSQGPRVAAAVAELEHAWVALMEAQAAEAAAVTDFARGQALAAHYLAQLQLGDATEARAAACRAEAPFEALERPVYDEAAYWGHWASPEYQIPAGVKNFDISTPRRGVSPVTVRTARPDPSGLCVYEDAQDSGAEAVTAKASLAPSRPPLLPTENVTHTSFSKLPSKSTGTVAQRVLPVGGAPGLDGLALRADRPTANRRRGTRLR